MLAKYKLKNVEVLISRASIHSCISHKEFLTLNDVLK